MQLHAFCRNAIRIELLYSGFLLSNVQTFYTKFQPYIFPIQGLHLLARYGHSVPCLYIYCCSIVIILIEPRYEKTCLYHKNVDKYAYLSSLISVILFAAPIAVISETYPKYRIYFYFVRKSLKTGFLMTWINTVFQFVLVMCLLVKKVFRSYYIATVALPGISAR